MIYRIINEKQKYPFAVTTLDGKIISRHLKYDVARMACVLAEESGMEVQLVKYRGN